MQTNREARKGRQKRRRESQNSLRRLSGSRRMTEAEFQKALENSLKTIGATPSSHAPQPAQVAVLDPTALINDCITVTYDANNSATASINTAVFAEKYDGKRVKYSGTVDSLKKDSGIIVFKGSGKWPKNWHVEASPPAGTAVSPKKGDQLAVDGTITALLLPDVDVAMFGVGPSRTIRLEKTTVVEQ